MEDSQENGASECKGLAASRSRRTLRDKGGRNAALAKLRDLKGSKNKYQVSEVAPVYEEVDEREYCRRRQDKMEKDWIVDDDGSGYVEDGREIFDEEDDVDDAIFTSRKGTSKHEKKKKKNNGGTEDGQPSIRSLLSNMPVRKRKAESQISLADDELLGDILEEMSSSLPKPSLVKKPRPSTSPHQAYAPINPFASKRPHSPKPCSANSQSNDDTASSRSRDALGNQSPAGTKQARPGSVSQSPSLSLALKSKASARLEEEDVVSGGLQEISTYDGTPSRKTQDVVPRPVFRENLPATSPPKAKRSLTIEASKEKAEVKIETEADFADVDFSVMDDMVRGTRYAGGTR
ncbi:DNA polymerase alpha catalytic subunit N-terminal domain [Trinorchestia longiramus]|nr:DNA polymerase alpha catalytic subunit N-terminal domain [Trinorchestia longiramus]